MVITGIKEPKSAKVTAPGWYVSVPGKDLSETAPYATLDQVSLDIHNGKIPMSRTGEVRVSRLAGPDVKRADDLRAVAREEKTQRVARLRESHTRCCIATGVFLAATVGYGFLGATMPSLVNMMPVVSNALTGLPEAIRGAVLLAMPFACFAAFANQGRQYSKQMIAEAKPDERLADKISQPHWAEQGSLRVQRTDPLGPANGLIYHGVKAPGGDDLAPTRFSSTFPQAT